IMGCYGIGINRILAAAVEIGHDKDGCIFPVNIAPFEVEVIPLNSDVEAVVGEASRIYDALEAAGADVLLDDRDVRPGVKFKDADLIGMPLRVVVGERSLKEGNVEIKRRSDPKPTQVPAADAVREALKALQEMKKQ
ncbi:MAG TPA: His/Gly/Thr/Pro-type tRNA ligase C-terminal domain-containing protein, partial [Phycisphaerae bacterium]|nr:His/Gly/Thr/Pro-type tRNA ligase C-terminal domain-containing protein [Phycisphaerae bacterium]